MKQITLSKLEISNFKGIKTLCADFSQRTLITGANASGKSSVQDAFFWCLFGTNAQGQSNFSARPLDPSNHLIPDLEVKVSATLHHLGMTTTFARILAAGKKDNSATYIVNDVPCKMAEFKEKLNAICPEEDFKLLSSVNYFFSLDTKTARAKLQKIAAGISDHYLAKTRGFSTIVKAFAENKTVEELKREVAAKKQKASKRLEEIPTAINAQEALRPNNVDFEKLKQAVKNIDKEIASIDSQLQKSADANSSVLESLKADRNKLNELKTDLQDLDSSIEREYRKQKTELEDKKRDYCDIFEKRVHDIKLFEAEKAKIVSSISTQKEKLEELKTQWCTTNQQEFVASLQPSCPACGKPYQEQKLLSMEATQIERFNKHKLDTLRAIESQAMEAKETKQILESRMDKIIQSITTFTVQKENADTLNRQLESKIQAIPAIEVAKLASKERQKITSEIQEIDTKIKAQDPETSTDEQLQVRKQELQIKLSGLNRELGREQLNQEIDQLKETLKEEERTLSQAVAECQQIEDEIKRFNKCKIEQIEESVSSLFSLVKFKMYEQNLTNDSEKEICDCIVDGVPYLSLNTAKKINAAIDIINGFAKGLGITVPVWIDNKESVSRIIESPSQIITLEVVQGEKLTIN